MFKKSAFAAFALLLAGSVFAKDGIEGGSKKKPGRPVKAESVLLAKDGIERGSKKKPGRPVRIERA